MDKPKIQGSYWKLKEEELDRTAWKARLGRGYGLVVRQSRYILGLWYRASFIVIK